MQKMFAYSARLYLNIKLTEIDKGKAVIIK